MLLQIINFVEIRSNQALKQTSHYDGGHVKQKLFRQIQTSLHFLAYSGIIRHIPASSEIIQGYSRPCINLTYSEPWYIQNQRHSQNFVIFRLLVYSEPLHIQNQKYIQIPGILRTRGIFRTVSIIYNGVFCENSVWL